MTIGANSGIYAITNIINGKTYIGSTTNFKRRWYEHINELRYGTHCNPYLQSSWNKHGEKMFKFDVLEYLDNPEDLTKAEQLWMDKYREEGKKLYNCGLAADCPARGCKRTEEQCHRNSESLMGHEISKETRYKISKALIGYKHSKETRRNMSKAQEGNQHALGYKHAKEAKHNMSIAAQNRSKDHRYKLGEAMIGNQHALGHIVSKEARHRMGEANAKPYPALIHEETGNTILAGVNLSKLCKERGLNVACMHHVVRGKQYQHRGWALASSEQSLCVGG